MHVCARVYTRVKDASTVVLPGVRPGHTLVLVVLTMGPLLASLWTHPHPKVRE